MPARNTHHACLDVGDVDYSVSSKQSLQSRWKNEKIMMKKLVGRAAPWPRDFCRSSATAASTAMHCTVGIKTRCIFTSLILNSDCHPDPDHDPWPWSQDFCWSSATRATTLYSRNKTRSILTLYAFSTSAGSQVNISFPSLPSGSFSKSSLSTSGLSSQGGWFWRKRLQQEQKSGSWRRQQPIFLRIKTCRNHNA